MKNSLRGVLRVAAKCTVLVLAIIGAGLLQPGVAAAQTLTLTVTGSGGVAVTGYRWTLEEDATFHVEPGVSINNPPSVGFNKSFMPVVASGTSADPIPIPDPTKHYFLSVLPDADYGLGAAAIAPGQTSAEVAVNGYPVPTAQISVLIFEDNRPMNIVPDLPEEPGLEGFTILVSEEAGQLLTDTFGNDLGTTYQQDLNGIPILDPNGDPIVNVLGTGVITTDAQGRASIKHLAPGKYLIHAVPPTDQAWVQTTTIEGGMALDAFVKSGEAPFVVEFAPPGVHVAIGFMLPLTDTTVLVPGAGTTLTGRVVNLHNARPPNFLFSPGAPLSWSNCYVGLNDLGIAAGKAIYFQPCNADSTFTIPDVPPGNYELITTDQFHQTIFGTFGVIVAADGTCTGPAGPITGCAFGDVSVPTWFGRLELNVFADFDEDGFRDPGEVGIPEVNFNLRFRDGTIYQAYPTDATGFLPFDQIFPFFHWLVLEVDFARFKATGVTVVTDGGGAVPPDAGWDNPSLGLLTPQPQYQADGVTPLINPNTGNNLSRTETGPVLLEGFQIFTGLTSSMDFGKAPYGRGQNGGISGIVHYATTRAEDDPRFAAAEEWEPGIPRVVVNLYQDFNADGTVDDLNGNLIIDYADADNYPFGNFPSGEDVDRNNDGLFDLGDAVRTTTTDSWDDNLPTGCQGPIYNFRGNIVDCMDGLRNFNQTRPALFDGGFAFGPNVTGDGSPELRRGTYIVEAVTPPGYTVMAEEHRNVDFGDPYLPTPAILPPSCVGDLHTVPAELALFPGVPGAYGGQNRPLCDRKQIRLADRINGDVNFFLFTDAPISGHVVGFLLDDLSNDNNPESPNNGEKYAPPWLPVSVRDFTGREVQRVYSDEFGTYNFLVPSTFSVHIPMPSGVAPNVVDLCLNDPGPIADPLNPGQFIVDPFFRRNYGQFCWTVNATPGTTTYLDTPIQPIAAAGGPSDFPVDCEFPEGTPRIFSVNGPVGGPYVPNPGTNPRISIASMSSIDVPNPEFDGPGGVNPTTTVRDYGFGASRGVVTLGGVELVNVTWTNGVISGDVPAGATTGQLAITRGDNSKSTITGLTVTVGALPAGNSVHQVQPSPVFGATPIQDAIDMAVDGDLILIAPGNYVEMVIMDKPVRLQGYGDGSVFINASRTVDKVASYQDKIQAMHAASTFDLLPAQSAKVGPNNNVINALALDQFSGITVLAKAGAFGAANTAGTNARIDGLTVYGANTGGGIMVNGYADFLEISNTHIFANQGLLGGGLRVGHPLLANDVGFEDAQNDNIRIHNNHISQNGGFGGGGGGVSLCTGTDFYEVTQNFICGNTSAASGAGISHLGLSNNGRIANNTIVFNQNPAQGAHASGGGISVGGTDPLPNDVPLLTPGSGNVEIVSNLIVGNQSGAGDGGGIRIVQTNGVDVDANPTDPTAWYQIDILNNIIVNNVSGLAGGGISLQDAINVVIEHNTVANNDSVAIAGEAFVPGDTTRTVPYPAGIVSRAHSPDLANAIIGLGLPGYSDPTLVNNIVWHNRSFSFQLLDVAGVPSATLSPDIGAGEPPVYDDLAVLGAADILASLNPLSSILTDVMGYDPSNSPLDPLFDSEYVNAARNALALTGPSSMDIAAAFDEGGNFLDVRFAPLTLSDPTTGVRFGSYHLTDISPALGAGAPLAPAIGAPNLATDIDGDVRPLGDPNPDIGADEWVMANTPPVAIGETYSVAQDTTLNVAAPGVVGNDVDVDNTALTAVLFAAPTSGTLSLNANGSFTYAPNAGFFGTDSFTYFANDGTVNSLTPATVTITVTALVNQPPVPANDLYSVVQGTTLNVTAPGVLANDTDVNLDPLTAVLNIGPTNGTLTLNALGSFTYTPNALFTGPDSFTYFANDGTVNSFSAALVTISVTAPPLPTVGSPPMAKEDEVKVAVGTSIINILANDTDPDGDLDPATVTIVRQPTGGASVIVNPLLDGTVIFTATTGEYKFFYTVGDLAGNTSRTEKCAVKVQ